MTNAADVIARITADKADIPALRIESPALAINRRLLLASALLSPFAAGTGMLARAQTANGGLGSSILRHEKSFRTADEIWIYALSPDARSIATVGFQLRKVHVIDITSEHPTEIEIPDLRLMTIVAWTQDGTKLAIANISSVVIVSIEQGRVIQQIDNIRGVGIGFGDAALFSRDGTKLYLQNGNSQSKYQVIEIDLASGTIRPFSEVPGADAPVLSIKRGRLQHLRKGDVFSTAIGYSDGTKDKSGGLTFDYQCFVLPLTPKQTARAPIHFIADTVHGIDGSGVMRQFFEKSLYSEPADLTVVFRESGTKLQNVPIDVSKDKAFETYDAAGRRISTFGGYGALEGNYINGFDVHPAKPWAVTTASRVTLPDGRAVGMVTIWDLATGTPLQRLETATQIGNPVVSQDGTLLMANADDGINIFRFV
jgi:WD40 repeat protein